MIVAWVLFPLVLLAVCLGCGLLVEWIAGWRLPGALILPLGLVLVIVAATLMTYKGTTAKLTTALVGVLALAGCATSVGRLRQLRPERFALIVGLAVYAVCAAPIVLSGNATFLGYFELNDSAVHFALINHLMSHGRDLSGVHPSSLLGVLQSYISTDYPVGADVALGAVRPLVGQNVVWIFQPYLAVIVAFGAVVLYQLLDGVVSSRPLRALCAFVAGQPALVYGLYLEASVKELTTVWLISLTVVLVVTTLKEALSVRRLVPLALVTVAAFDVLNVSVVPWLGVPLAAFAIVALWGRRHVISRVPRRRLALLSGACVLVLAVIAFPIIATAKTSFNVVSAQLTISGDLGNLPAPLSKWQILGIWPSGDFRFRIGQDPYRIRQAAHITDALIGVAVLSAVLGTAWAIWRRAAAPLLLLAGSGLAAIYLLDRASPYASIKVMMIFSLAVMLMVMLGAVALYEFGRGLQDWGRAALIPGWALALVITAGVLWSNVEAYRAVKVAPRARFSELASIGSRFSGQGPAFYNLGDEFAIDFLGSEIPTDTAYQQPIARPGARPRVTLPELREPWDPDELASAYLQSFHLLVLGRSPLTSRPPANYQLAYRGRFYEVWQRSSTPQVLDHVALGGGLSPAAVPRCSTVTALATRASREHARLAYASVPPMSILLPTRAQHPAKWTSADNEPSASEPALEPYSFEPYAVLVRRSGSAVGTVHVARRGRYEVWLEGSFSRDVRVRVDGVGVRSDSYEIGPLGQFVPMGEVALEAGAHRVAIVAQGESLAPGERSRRQTLGPLVLVPAPDDRPVAEIAPSRARALCGRALDWIEIVR